MPAPLVLSAKYNLPAKSVAHDSGLVDIPYLVAKGLSDPKKFDDIATFFLPSALYKASLSANTFMILSSCSTTILESLVCSFWILP